MRLPGQNFKGLTQMLIAFLQMQSDSSALPMERFVLSFLFALVLTKLSVYSLQTLREVVQALSKGESTNLEV